jgi:hypothetical protein
MLTGPEIGLIGGILGGILGCAGGVFGTYCSIKNTRGPLERRFMIKISVIGWFAILLFLALLLNLPTPYRFLMWIPYGIGLPLGIRHTNNRQKQIQILEQKNQIS